MPAVTAEDFAAALGIEQLPDECRKLVEQHNFEYSLATPEEHDRLVLETLKKLDARQFSVVGEHRRDVWQKGWGENLREFEASNFEADALLPSATLSSPTLMLQLRITAFVSAKSMASVLCDGFVGSDEAGAVIVMPSIVTFPARPLIIRCIEGEFENVASRIHTRLQVEKFTIAGRLFVLYPGHHGEPCPSIAPLPLISISCRLDPLMKFAGETMPPGYLS